jgi:hypothetical protein
MSKQTHSNLNLKSTHISELQYKSSRQLVEGESISQMNIDKNLSVVQSGNDLDVKSKGQSPDMIHTTQDNGCGRINGPLSILTIIFFLFDL